ncbi:hypothetical protein [Pengzhenrongella sp.]|jgi:hypothetical protein|uniref:hypothetical protein n=1 Tax=Pengzhenrongella sp. TaxID=2888820 RepID=UPI002F91E5B8
MTKRRVAASLVVIFVAGTLSSTAIDNLELPARLPLFVAGSIAAWAVLGALRAAVPSGAGRGPLLLLGVAAVVVAWQAEAWLPIRELLLPLVLIAAAVLLSGIARETSQVSNGPYAMNCWFWTARPVAWTGPLTPRLSASVVAGSATIDMTQAFLSGETELNLTLAISRLTILIPSEWPLVTSGPIAGWGVRVEDDAPAQATDADPPIIVHVLGLCGVVAFRRSGSS